MSTWSPCKARRSQLGCLAPPMPYDITVASMSPISALGALTRVNLATGQVTVGPSLLAASDLLVVGKAVAVLSPSGTAANGVPLVRYRLRFVLSHSVALGPPIELNWAGSTESLLSDGPSLTHGGIWLPTPKGAQLLSTTSGAVLETLAFGVHVSDIAPSPDGKRLYVVLDELSANPDATISTVTDEVDAVSGRVVAHQAIKFGVGGAVLTPVRGGVWVSYRGGMAGTSVLYRSAGLASVPWPRSAVPFSAVPRYGGEQIMGFSATSLDDTLWLRSGSGISCLVPSAGRFLAGISFASGKNPGAMPWTPFAASNGLVYATAANRIIALRPPSICGLGR